MEAEIPHQVKLVFYLTIEFTDDFEEKVNYFLGSKIVKKLL